MIQEKGIRWKLFLSTLQISAFTFGGGFVIIPLMRKKFVVQLRWIGEQEMMDLTAIAQSSPGAIAVNASILVGYRIAGMSGALLSVLAAVLPPLVILSVISFFYAAVRDNATVGLLMKGMQAGVAAVICDVVLSMGLSIIRLRKALPILVMTGSFIAVWFFKANIIAVIMLCGAIGAADAFRKAKSGKENAK